MMEFQEVPTGGKMLFLDSLYTLRAFRLFTRNPFHNVVSLSVIIKIREYNFTCRNISNDCSIVQVT